MRIINYYVLKKDLLQWILIKKDLFDEILYIISKSL